MWTVKFSRPNLYLDYLAIPNVSECKCLGVIIYALPILLNKNCDPDLKR